AAFTRLRAAFDQLIERGPEERVAELSRLRAEDPAFANELRELLAAADEPATPLDATALSFPKESEAWPSIDGFEIRRRLGRGGSATVYLAAQRRPEVE